MGKTKSVFMVLIVMMLALVGCEFGGGEPPDVGDSGGLNFNVRPAGERPTATFAPTEIPELTLGEDGRETTIEDSLEINGRWGNSLLQGEAHNYTFEGTAGQQLAITVQRVGDSGNPAFDLYGPDNKLILGDALSGFNRYDAMADVDLPADGSYTIRVYMYDVQRGSYAINLLER